MTLVHFSKINFHFCLSIPIHLQFQTVLALLPFLQSNIRVKCQEVSAQMQWYSHSVLSL